MTYQRSADALQVELEGRTVLLHATRWQYLDFDPIGGEIWQMLATPHSLQDVVAALRARYRVAEETCRKDTEAVLQQLVDGKYLLANT